ncbi:MAG TPA: SDR family NAD(P)-dependent oxidoreductase [Roseomonas sp.]|jgi:short-subunit dehydrogenase
MAVYPWRSVLITGASSGLGRALAEALAAPGVTLHLTGRDAVRLAEAAAACRARGATVAEAMVDVRDAAAMEALIRGAGRLDLVVANAGISAGTGGLTEPADQARAIMAVNVTGMLNTAIPALEVMAAQSPGADGVRGRVAVIASIAGFVAAPGAPAYCASKFAARAWAEAADGAARPQGLRVHAICPGYVRTAMTARNAFPMPLLMDAAVAARRTLDGIALGRVRVIYPRRLYAVARLLGALPPSWLSALMRLFPAKARDA